MKRFLATLILLASSLGNAEAEVKERHWLVGLGPVFSGALIGQGGTKFGLELSYVKQVAERLNTRYWFSGAYNTASLGSSQSTGIGFGIDIYTKDRGAETSPYILVDLGYGGGTRDADASVLGGLGLGMEFFRKNEASVRFHFKRLYNFTNRVTTTGSSAISTNPYYDCLIVGVNF